MFCVIGHTIEVNVNCYLAMVIMISKMIFYLSHNFFSLIDTKTCTNEMV